MEKTLTFDFWTSMRECCGSQVGSTVQITLPEADADRFCNLFATADDLSGDQVEEFLGEELWSLLRNKMDSVIFRVMDASFLYEFEGEIEESYNESHASDSYFIPWQELPKSAKLDFMASTSDRDADWDIAAVSRPELL